MGLSQLCGRGPAGLVGPSLTMVGLLAVLATGTLHAQETGRGLDSASILQLKPDRFVRIQLPELGRIQGRVSFHSSSEMVLQMEGESRAISLAAVDTLWVRGRGTKTGAIIGGLLGIGGGIFLGALADGLCEYDCGGNYVVGGAIFGAVTGGAAGAIIGTAIPRWRRVFPE